MTIDNKEPLALQVGHTYVRADGSKHTIKDDDGGGYGAPMYSGNHWYHRDGTSNTFNRRNDLISEYKEPTTQGKWEPWIGWNGGECPVGGRVIVDFTSRGVEYYSSTAGSIDWGLSGAYRVRQKPPAFTDSVWVAADGAVYLTPASQYRKAIITTQGDNISIRWADDG